jgi:Ion channel
LPGTEAALLDSSTCSLAAHTTDLYYFLRISNPRPREGGVSSIPALVGSIPDDLKPIASLCIGAFMLVCLVLFHGTCLHYILSQHRRGVQRLLIGRPHRIAASLLFGWAIFLMLDLHVAEILIWAAVLGHIGVIVRPGDAIYFCANAYTTMGYGAVDLATAWRNITPIIAISGLFTFAWTTSSLVTVISANAKLGEQLDEEREREIEMRRSLRQQERDILVRERTAEQSQKLSGKTKTQTAGSILEKYKIWRDEKRGIGELRRETLTELQALRRKERLEEEKLGPGKLDSTDGK